MTIVYLDFIIYKTSTIGGKYHVTEYCEEHVFRMKSHCGIIA